MTTEQPPATDVRGPNNREANMGYPNTRKSWRTRRYPGKRIPFLANCRTCNAVLNTQHGLPDLCPYCGADPLRRQHPAPAPITELELWLLGQDDGT